MANPKVRGFIRWRNWAKKDWAVAAVGLTVIIISAITFFFDSETDRLDIITLEDLVDLTLVHNAKDRGAFCLDGSLPAYHFQKGFGSGSTNWLLHIEGGGWCDSIESCSFRKRTKLGSSNSMERQVPFSGILSRHQSQNPDFFNWNKVKIRYCDGASLAGHPENESKNGTQLYFRGQLIWEAIMDELLSIGLSNAKKALLSGCSAGGLSTLIHCDSFRALLPKDATVKCLADAGFFLDEKDILGHHTMRSFYHNVVDLQGVEKSLHKNCIARMGKDYFKCLFPREIIKDIMTPVFLVNPAYDFWQIQHILVSVETASHGHWEKCRLNLNHCSPSQMEILQGYRDSMLNALGDFQKNELGGMFINSCFIHCQTWMAETWHSPTSPKINNKTIAESVGDWYFNRGVVKKIDCPYPCNPTCYNMDFL
ncbi:pectin acetylesterase 5-like [Euphorbia lathyris]|uniref:pectin acetylesterase 5-like n=1 Tax=Euphorbia lathyris TaxID=212925 RepID=UPI0033131F40